MPRLSACFVPLVCAGTKCLRHLWRASPHAAGKGGRKHGRRMVARALGSVLDVAVRIRGPPTRTGANRQWPFLKSQPRLKHNRYTGLFRAYAYPALYPDVTRITRIR